MQTKKHFMQYINDVQTIISPLQIHENKLGEIKGRIETAELIVPVVGGFSAGKSTLINSFLGCNILPTAITPETALATELHYSETDHIEALTSSGNVERYEIADFPKLKDNAKNFKNLRLFLNNDQLKAIRPLILVDMPGFDAPIENHNTAILTYLERGVYFVFLTSVEDGNITLSMRREIENLQRFSKGFAFCISKTDLRGADDVQTVKEKIAEQLQDYFDHTDEIALLDMDGGSNLNRILQAIDPERLFHSLFIDDLRDNYVALTESINVKISTFKGSKKDAEDTIAALHNSITQLTAEKEAALAEAEQRYSDKSVANIAEKVAQSLRQRKDKLVELALHNPATLSYEINDLVKNNLLAEVQRSFQNIGSNILNDFSSRLQTNFMQSNHLLDAGMLDRIRSSTELLLNRTLSGLGSLAESMKERSKTSDSKTIYRVLATITGITTSVVAPIVEILIIFLPDMINFFTKSTQERKAREQAEQQIMHTVIPDVTAKIRQNLPELFHSQINALISQIGEQFEQQLQQKSEEIQAAETEKVQKAAELENLIAELEEGKKQLNSLANQYLFA